MKKKLMKTLRLTAMGMVIPLMLTVPCWSADTRRAEPQVRQTAPETPPARPRPPKSPLNLKAKTQGKLSTVGKQVRLRLNRSVTRVEVFAGRKKLAALGAGISFDITPYVSQACKDGLTFHYFSPDGQKSAQTFGHGEIQKFGRKTKKTAGKPAPLRPPSPASADGGRTPASDPSFRPGTPAGQPGAVSSHGVAASAASGIPGDMTTLAGLNITRPTQGDFMVEGDPFVLQWSGIGKIQEHCVNIYLTKVMRSHDNRTIAENVCINGYQWQVPSGVSGTGFMIRIRTIDNILEDVSVPFSILSSQPDLSVTNLHIQQTNPDMRDDITVLGVVQNSGHGTVASSRAMVKLQSGDWTSNPVLVNVPTLVFGPNAREPFSVTFPPPHSSPPENRPSSLDITAVVTADIQGQVTEADEGNNQAQITFHLAPLPNLIPGISDEVHKGMSKKVKIQFALTNHSSVPVGATVCRTWIEKKGHRNHNVPALGSGESHVFTREVFFAVAGWRDYSLKVDYGDNVREGYEDDNVKTGRIHAKSGVNVKPVKLPPVEEARFPVLRGLYEWIKFW